MATAAGGSPLVNMQDLGNLVRHWVHYDSLIANLNKQAAVARKERDAYEDRIMGSLRAAKYENAVIQIAGGKLMVNEEKHTQGLTYKSLEQMLHDYYIQKVNRGVACKDETDDILKFIKANRQTDSIKRLKKIATNGQAQAQAQA